MGKKYFKYGRLKFFFKRCSICNFAYNKLPTFFRIHFNEKIKPWTQCESHIIEKVFYSTTYILTEKHDRAYKWHLNHECRFLQRLAFVTLLIK